MQLRTKFGNPAPHTQQVIRESDGLLFTSYGHCIAKRYDDGRVDIFPSWNASVTTGGYRNSFLGENIAATRKKINKGIYRLVDRSGRPMEYSTVYGHMSPDGVWTPAP